MFSSISTIARPLYDLIDGGPVCAYKCLLNISVSHLSIPCEKVFRTERGMKAHLRKSHGWVEQPTLMIPVADVVAKETRTPRRKRIPSLKVEDLPANRKSIPVSPEPPATANIASASALPLSNRTLVKST